MYHIYIVKSIENDIEKINVYYFFLKLGQIEKY